MLKKMPEKIPEKMSERISGKMPADERKKRRYFRRGR